MLGEITETSYLQEYSPTGDLPYLDWLLGHGVDVSKIEYSLYGKYGQEGRLEEAKLAVNKLQKGLEYAKSVFPKVKNYIDRELVEKGYAIREDVRINDPKVLPLKLPSETIEGEVNSNGKKEEFYGFSGAAAGVTHAYRHSTPHGYLMFANLPLAYLSQDDVDPIGLHEYLHMYLAEIGIPDEEQKKLEPEIDRWVINCLKINGKYEMASRYERQSGYLNNYIV